MPGESRMDHRVEWGETDSAGIVFYPNFYRWFDRGTHELFRRLDYPVPTMVAEGFVIPLIETHARFLSPLRYDDSIAIHSRIEELRTRSFRVAHVVVRGDARACEGYEVRAWVRVRDGVLRAEPIPHHIRDLLVPE